MSFKIGDKVVCIGGDEMARSNHSYNEKIFINQIYEVSVGSWFSPLTEKYHINLTGMATWWAEKYFRKLSEVSAEISEEIMEKVLTSIPELV